jgi:hypothetical protein
MKKTQTVEVFAVVAPGMGLLVRTVSRSPERAIAAYNFFFGDADQKDRFTEMQNKSGYKVSKVTITYPVPSVPKAKK